MTAKKAVKKATKKTVAKKTAVKKTATKAVKSTTAKVDKPEVTVTKKAVKKTANRARRKLEAPSLVQVATSKPVKQVAKKTAKKTTARVAPNAPKTESSSNRNKVNRLLAGVTIQEDKSSPLEAFTDKLEKQSDELFKKPEEPMVEVDTSLAAGTSRARREVKRRPTREGTISFDDMIQADINASKVKPNEAIITGGFDLTQHFKKS